MTDILGLVRRLAAAEVEFIIVGGVAANIHGALRTTLDLDVVYARHRANLDRLVGALAPISPYLRGAPPGLPFVLDTDTLARGLNFTLATADGDLDLLGEVAGGGDYDRLKGGAEVIRLEGREVLVVDLATLIALKRAAGRGRDREALAELEVLLEERKRQ